MGWGKISGYVVSLCGLDLATHYQLLPQRWLDFQNSPDEELPESQSCFDLVPSHSSTGTVLFYSSIIRMLLLISCFKLCQKKSIPKFIHPYMSLLTMTTTFTFCSVTMWRLLLDSEPPNTVAYSGYIFLLTIDITFPISEYLFCQYIIKNSGAVTKPEELEKGQDKKKSKKDDDEEKEERTVPFFIMTKKLSYWYKSEWRLIAFGYVLLMFGISGILDLHLQ